MCFSVLALLTTSNHSLVTRYHPSQINLFLLEYMHMHIHVHVWVMHRLVYKELPHKIIHSFYCSLYRTAIVYTCII